MVDVNAAALDMGRIVDAKARDSLAGRIRSVLGPGVDAVDGFAEAVLGFFCQTLELVPDIHAHVEAQARAFVRQVGGLAGLLSRLEMTPLKLRVKGTAGCGKSMLAREAFDREVARGRRPLLVCFNRSLSERLKAVCAAGGGYVDLSTGFAPSFWNLGGRRSISARCRTIPGSGARCRSG